MAEKERFNSKSKRTLKTFNLDSEIYKQFSAYCKKEGISMSRKIENFLKQEINKIQSFKIDKKPKTDFSRFC